jgi:hypothetical protein
LLIERQAKSILQLERRCWEKFIKRKEFLDWKPYPALEERIAKKIEEYLENWKDLRITRH